MSTVHQAVDATQVDPRLLQCVTRGLVLRFRRFEVDPATGKPISIRQFAEKCQIEFWRYYRFEHGSTLRLKSSEAARVLENLSGLKTFAEELVRRRG